MVKNITLTNYRAVDDPQLLQCLGGAQIIASNDKHDHYKRELGRAWCFEAVLSGSGTLIHNGFHLKKSSYMRFIEYKLFQKIPLLPYLFYKHSSCKYHYLTDDSTDKNIRQVVIKFIKK